MSYLDRISLVGLRAYGYHGVLPAERAITEEARLIARLRPRDNLIGQPDERTEDEPVPF